MRNFFASLDLGTLLLLILIILIVWDDDLYLHD